MINMIRADNMMKLNSSSTYTDLPLALTSKAITATAQLNSSQSLLKLPPEIKDQIYELVCGGQFLHVNHCWTENELRFTYDICHAQLSEQAAEELFHAETTAKWFVSAVEPRHSECYNSKEHLGNLSTDFLRTCRQVYTEARHIPYATNTFSFIKTRTLEYFTNYLKNSGHGHHLEIRRVHLDVVAQDFQDERFWKLAIADCLVPRLPAVHRLSINLDQWYEAGVVGCRTPAEFKARHLSGNYLMSALLELRKLPLNRATFVISDAKILSRMCADRYLARAPFIRWTLAEKQIWARYVKDYILQKDDQRETSSDLAVERDMSAGQMMLGFESLGEEKGDRKLESQEEEGAATEV
ncbi:MAG: hypothetical protein ASARMPRED_008944 [Alectoria sarmentosa]|nr:MAG: hypothetical protein ASARMPRED_008944 [Alectoria sarmentosa]